ncbi:MAG: hypothetical protein IPM29_24830 [Planctomycetes bacterium]|nr:hypothetical protein [Planctomycetota bacterium]
MLGVGVSTDASGAARIALPLGFDPAWIGLDARFQFGIADPGGAPPGLSASAALRVFLGI